MITSINEYKNQHLNKENTFNLVTLFEKNNSDITNLELTKDELFQIEKVLNAMNTDKIWFESMYPSGANYITRINDLKKIYDLKHIAHITKYSDAKVVARDLKEKIKSALIS